MGNPIGWDPDEVKFVSLIAPDNEFARDIIARHASVKRAPDY